MQDKYTTGQHQDAASEETSEHTLKDSGISNVPCEYGNLWAECSEVEHQMRETEPLNMFFRVNCNRNFNLMKTDSV